MTEEEKNKILAEHISMLYDSGRSYDTIGRHIEAVKHYLDYVEAVGTKSYKEYMQHFAEEIVRKPARKEALLLFIGWRCRGFRGGKKSRKEKPLERLSDLSDKNEKLINGFILYMENENDYSSHTLYSYAMSMKKFFMYANEFNMDNCRRFIRTMEEDGLSPKTIRLRITGLEKFGEYIKKPVKLKRPKIKRELQVDNVPTEKDYEKLLEYLSVQKNRDYYFFIKILATTGARCSEFLQITWEDIMAGEKVMKGKGNKYRRFFFNYQLRKEVAEYIHQTGKSGTVATGRFGTLTERGLNQHMKLWADKCGIDRRKMHPHAFRHFFAKMFLKRNKDVVQLADLMGHGSIDTTRIYLQRSYEEQKRDFNRNVTW